MSIAPKKPRLARAAISSSVVGAKAAATETAAKPIAPIMQQPAPADAVAEAAHRDEQAGEHERVGVDDPEHARCRSARVPARSTAARS